MDKANFKNNILFITFVVIISLQNFANAANFYLISKPIVACSFMKPNTDIIKAFADQLKNNNGFKMILDDFCKNGGQGEVFSSQLDMVGILKSRGSFPPSPPGEIFIKITRVPNINTQNAKANWYIDKYLNEALAYFVDPSISQPIFLPDFMKPDLEFLITNSQIYGPFAGAIIKDRRFENSLMNNGIISYGKRVMFISSHIRLDTLIHEYKHLEDREEESRLFQAIENFSKMPNIDEEKLRTFETFLQEGAAYIRQIAYLKGELFKNVNQICSIYREEAQDDQRTCIDRDEYIRARIEGLYSKIKLYSPPFYGGEDACNLIDFLDSFFDSPDQKALNILKSKMTRGCSVFKNKSK